MNRPSVSSPPFAKSLSASITVAVFAFCFYHFSENSWPDWGSYAVVQDAPSPPPATSEGSKSGDLDGPSDAAYSEDGDRDAPKVDPNIRWVVIDPGHGGVDGGTQGNGILEKNYALDIAKHLRSRLKEFGIPVIMTRDDDSVVKLSKRSEIANKINCAAFVSIHLNYSTVPAVSGVETFFSDPKGSESLRSARDTLGIPSSTKISDGRGKLLAAEVQDRICASTGANDRGIKNRRLLVTLNTHAPAVLIECGFLSHAGESSRLKKESYRKEIAAAVAGGITHFLEKTKADPLHGILFTDPSEDPRSVPSTPPLAQVPPTSG